MRRFPGPPTTRVPRLAGAALAATLLLVAAGGYTRGSGSGYGCRDRWPLCEGGALGGYLPRADSHMIVEWSHRWLAGVVVILILLTVIAAWRARYGRGVVAPAAAALIVVSVQAYLGRLVVTHQLDADLVSLHLTIAMVVAALMATTLVHALPRREASAADRMPPDRRWAALLATGAFTTLAVLVLGSMVHNEYVGGWPLVDGHFIPGFADRVVVVHYLHRIAAAAGTALVAVLAVASVRRNRPRVERRLVFLALACYAGNVALGAAHVATQVRSSAVVVAHLTLASLAWTCLVLAVLLARRHDDPAVDVELAPVGDAERCEVGVDGGSGRV